MRTFRQIMHDLYEHRQAGLTLEVSLSSCLADDEWQVIWDKLMWVARLEKTMAKYRTGQR